MESSGSDFKTLFLILYEIVQFYEGYTIKVDPNLLFKSANIAENICSKLESLGAVKEFENQLNKFWELQGLTYIPLKFFSIASHLILSRYLTDQRFSNLEVKLAVKLFIKYKSEKEFIAIAKDLSDTHKIVELMKKDLPSSKILHSNAFVFLEQLKKHILAHPGRVEEIEVVITKTVHKNKNEFEVLLRALCLVPDCELSVQVQEIIAISASAILGDIENIDLFPIIFNLCKEDFELIVTKWNAFTESFMNIIEISIKKLKCRYFDNLCTWGYDGLDTGLSFEDITRLINMLNSNQQRKHIIIDHLKNFKQNGLEIISEDIARTCKIGLLS